MDKLSSKRLRDPTDSDMELFVYATDDGELLADFRPYLDGYDHAFEDHRALGPADKRWEKVRNVCHPQYGDELAGRLTFVGKSEVEWRELMVFPILWDRGYDPVDWEEPAASS